MESVADGAPVLTVPRLISTAERCSMGSEKSALICVGSGACLVSNSTMICPIILKINRAYTPPVSLSISTAIRVMKSLHNIWTIVIGIGILV